MLTKRLWLKNFRRFEEYSIALRNANILVGPNNAGKSSVLDAFRLLASALRFAKHKRPRPIDVPGKGVFWGHELPATVFPFRIGSASRNYSDDDAVAEFAAPCVREVVRHLDMISHFQR